MTPAATLADQPASPLPQLVARIVDVLHPVQVWLFGSRARGNARADSDWDLLAILPDDAPEEDLELDAARRLIAEPPNRFAAFHLQQAAEKLVKAVRLGRGLRITADHSIARLLDELPHDDGWRPKLAVLEPLSSYATTYRYPSPVGRRKTGPSRDEVLVWIETIAGLSTEARALVKLPT